MPRQQHEPREGEVWNANLSPGIGGEQTGIRPVLVISNEGYNATQNHLVVVVPITGTDRGFTAHYKIRGREAGLSKHSVVMCDQVRTISPLRLLEKRGEVSATTLREARRLAVKSIVELKFVVPKDG